MTPVQQGMALYLTKEEKKLFDALPKELTGEWKVAAETHVFEDTLVRRKSRAALAKFKDAALQKFLKTSADAQSESALDEAIKTLDFTKLSGDDLDELFFVLGPDFLTASIGAILVDASTDEMLQAAAGLSGVRAAFYNSYKN